MTVLEPPHIWYYSFLAVKNPGDRGASKTGSEVIPFSMGPVLLIPWCKPDSDPEVMNRHEEKSQDFLGVINVTMAPEIVAIITLHDLSGFLMYTNSQYSDPCYNWSFAWSYSAILYFCLLPPACLL